MSATEIDENDVTILTGGLFDPGIEDTFTLSIDWGDGSPDDTLALPAGTTEFSVPHLYLDDDPTATGSDDYVVTVTVTDDDTGETTDMTTATVNNVAPDLHGVNISAPVLTGNVSTLLGNITDPGTEDTFDMSVESAEASEGNGIAVRLVSLPWSRK